MRERGEIGEEVMSLDIVAVWHFRSWLRRVCLLQRDNDWLQSLESRRGAVLGFNTCLIFYLENSHKMSLISFACSFFPSCVVCVYERSFGVRNSWLLGIGSGWMEQSINRSSEHPPYFQV